MPGVFTKDLALNRVWQSDALHFPALGNKNIVGRKESPIARLGRFPILDRFRHIRGREQIEIRAVTNAGSIQS